MLSINFYIWISISRNESAGYMLVMQIMQKCKVKRKVLLRKNIIQYANQWSSKISLYCTYAEL